MVAKKKGGNLNEGEGIVGRHDGDKDRDEDDLVAVAEEPSGDPFEGRSSEKYGDKFGSVEWMHWDHVEDCEHQVGERKEHEERAEGGSDDVQAAENRETKCEAADDGECEVHCRASERDDDVVVFRSAKVTRIVRYWLRPTESERDQHQKTDGIEVRERVQREATHFFRRIVATPLPHDRVRKFMKRQCDDECRDPREREHWGGEKEGEEHSAGGW